MGNGCSSAQMSECEKALERGRENHWCSLAGKGLKCVPPPAMEASTLLRLDLSRNMLRELPHTLGKLVNLQALFLRENRLVSLPEEIGLCVALEEIHADSNRLTALPDSVGDLFALRVLRLRDNLLHTVPNTLGRCHRLRVLDLQNNELQHLPYSLGALMALTEFVLQGNLDCKRPPTYMHAHAAQELVQLLATEGGTRTVTGGSEEYSQITRLQKETTQADDDALHLGEQEEHARREAARALFLRRQHSSEHLAMQTEMQVAMEASSLTQTSRLAPKAVNPNSKEVELEAAKEEMMVVTSSHRAYVHELRARNLTGAEALADEAAIAAHAVSKIGARAHSDGKLITRGEMDEAALLQDIQRERWRTNAELEKALQREDRRMLHEYQVMERDRRRQMQQDQQDIAAMAHRDRLETLASIQHGYEMADSVNRQLHAMLAQLGNSEATRFVWAAQGERAILQRVIRDQKAHAVAAVDTMNRLQSLHVKQSERERAVRAAVQLRSREFQIARWWAGVQHSLALETAQRNAAETALSAESLEDRRVWQESVLAARASASVAHVAEGNEEERAAAVRREASAVAAMTARIYEHLLANRPEVIDEDTARALLEAAIAQQLSTLGVAAAAGQQLVVDSLLEPLRAAAVLPISEATTDWRRTRALYVLPELERDRETERNRERQAELEPEPELQQPPEPEPALEQALQQPLEPEPQPQLEPGEKDGSQPPYLPADMVLQIDHLELDWPIQYMDPISLEPMLNPVRTAVGCVYDRQQISSWIERHRAYDTPLDPLTNLPLEDTTLAADEALRKEIAEFMRTGVPGPSAAD